VIPEANGWIVSAGSQSDHFDAVIIAAPAHAAASVLQSANDALARELAAINYSSSITVTLGYDEKVRRSLPPGFGFLIPHSAGHRMLAATFVHNKFPHRAPENRAIVRCFLGGARDEAILDYSDQQILQIVRDELRGIIALNAEPLFTRVYKWRSAMAQYSVGHIERVARIQKLCEKFPGLALAGNGFNGIGVPDCVRSGTEAATKVLSQLGMWSAA
jgi:protoporphyrinogen/coproporphyrinogen III oxidase